MKPGAVQTLKKWLRVHDPFATIAALQVSLDEFRDYYNHHRPHRSIGRIPPYQRWAGSPKATGDHAPLPSPNPRRRSHVVVTQAGVARLRGWQIGLGVDYAGLPAKIILDGTSAAIYIHDQLIRHIELDPTKRYQPSGRKRGGPRRPRPT